MFYRDAELALERWYSGDHRKPLIIRGARQVGKSTLVREFFKRRGCSLFEVNLERHVRLESVFASLDADNIIREIEFTCGKGKLDGGVVFLDEIQSVPIALKALRYLYEDRPDISVVAAGSLLEFAINEADFAMPVGRIRYMYLAPLSFHEFLNAVGAVDLAQLIMTWCPGEPFADSAHVRMLKHLRDFMLVGGMPESVERFVATGSLESSFETHLSILDTYRDDFGKYAGRAQVSRLRKLLDYVPLAIGEKFRYVRAIPDDRAKDVRQAIDLLATAGIISLVFHSDANGVPLGAEADTTVFKPLFLDIGLMNSVCGVQNVSLDALSDQRFVNEGKMAEQFTGQQLLTGYKSDHRPVLHYWLRDGLRANAEVDFLLEVGSSVIPVEVKAGVSGVMKSLHQFMAMKKTGLAIRFDLNPPSHQKVAVSVLMGKERETRSISYDLYSFPIYLACQVRRMAERLLQE